MRFPKFIGLLVYSALHFSRSDILAADDAFEGRLTYVNSDADKFTWQMIPEHLRMKKGYKSEDDFNTIQRLRLLKRRSDLADRELIFVNCWHIADHESAAMWKAYCGNNEGVCIQSTCGHLIDSMRDTQHRVFLGMMKYIDYKTEAINELDLFARYLHKRVLFEHERELRALVWRPADVESKFFFNDGTPATKDNFHYAGFFNQYPDRLGLNVQVDINRLVHTVYLSPAAPVWLADVAKAISERLGFRFQIRSSELSSLPPI